VLGVLGDRQGPVCVLQGDVGQGVAGGDDGHGEDPGHHWGDLYVVAERVESWGGRGSGAFGHDHVG
jgi:hypothetical protein